MKNILIKTIFFVLIIGFSIVALCCRTDVYSMGLGDEASDFTLERLNGEKIVLSEILKEKKAVLVFWTTWCFSCRKEVPRVEKFYAENKDIAAVVGINIRESKAKVESFVKKAGLSYPIALDSDGGVAGLYDLVGVPTIVAIDKNGKIMYYGHSIEEMVRKIDF